LFSGATALLSRKGARLHRFAGNVFLVSMLIMSAIGALASPFLPTPQWANVFMGAFTFYLVSTAWITIRRKGNSVGRFEVGAFVFAASFAVAALVVGTLAFNRPQGIIKDLPYQLSYAFAVVWALVATADLKLLFRGSVSRPQRIVRHLWRMCVALFIAALSFFYGQQQVFPAAVRGSPILFVPQILVMGSMLFWLFRVRLTKNREAARESAS
jgi:uncharacterized membrane protein